MLQARKRNLLMRDFVFRFGFILWLNSSFLLGCGQPKVTPTQPHHKSDGTFKDPYVTPPKKSFFSFLWMRMNTDWVDVSQANLVPQEPVDSKRLAQVNQPQEIQVTWLGHSCFLVQSDGFNLLTDPVFSERASPVSFAGPKRYTEPAIKINELPKIDAVVISHNHYDHLDLDSIELLEKHFDPQWYVPLKNGSLLESASVPKQRIYELDWWEQAEFKNSVQAISMIATPAQHWSARGLFDRNEMLWASWVIKIGSSTIFFGGDTGYQPKIFKAIGQKYGPFDIGLIPIGAYAPRSFMRYAHVNPSEAVNIHLDIKSKQSFGAHWGTFPLTAEPVMEPVQKLKESLLKNKLKQESFIAPILGKTYQVFNPKNQAQ